MSIPWFEPRMIGPEAAAVADVIHSGFINDGAHTADLERQIARRANRKFGVAVPSGTVAIALALLACGLQPGDDVIVPDLTFIATANAVKLAGGNVVLADVSGTHFGLTPETIEAVRTERTCFVMPVEVNGRAVVDDAFLTYCEYRGLTVVTDSCEALGSGWCGSFGAASCFSLSPNKLVTTGQGGVVVTNDYDILKRLRQLKFQGLDSRGMGGNDVHPTLGFNFKFTDLQAAVGLVQMQALDRRRFRALERDRWYREALAGVNSIEFPEQRGDVCLWADILTDDQPALATYLRDRGIGVREFWRPLHTQPAHVRATCNRALGQDYAFPGATRLSARGLWLPSSYDITRNQIEQVADAIKAFLGAK